MWVFDGEGTAGQWELWIINSGGSGTLTSWRVEVTPGGGEPPDGGDPNQPPVAGSDELQTNEGEPVTVEPDVLLVNDFDPDGDPLTVISVENDASWALAVIERMDDRWLHDKQWSRGDRLTSGRLPSEIFRDHVAASFMRDRTAILNRKIIGEGNLMWGSDFPHFDGAWPRSADILARQFEGIPLEDQVRRDKNDTMFGR